MGATKQAMLEQMDLEDVREAVRAEGHHTVGDLIEYLQTLPDEAMVLVDISQFASVPIDITDSKDGTFEGAEGRILPTRTLFVQ